MRPGLQPNQMECGLALKRNRVRPTGQTNTFIDMTDNRLPNSGQRGGGGVRCAVERLEDVRRPDRSCYLLRSGR
jgi:hypothetical protein